MQTVHVVDWEAADQGSGGFTVHLDKPDADADETKKKAQGCYRVTRFTTEVPDGLTPKQIADHLAPSISQMSLLARM
jgi:hypothetical protein